LPAEHRGVLAEGEREIALEHVRSLLEPPTAPYAEDAQVGVVRRFVAERDGFTLAEDEHANLIVTWNGDRLAANGEVRKLRSARVARSERASRNHRASKNERAASSTKRAEDTERPLALAFSAHLDHPGFEYLGLREGHHRARFHGGVPDRFFAGARVRFFDRATQEALATARIRSAERNEQHELIATLAEFRGRAARGMFGMWDLTAGAIRGRRLFARVCDDLMGAASILSLLDLLSRARHPRRVIGIFTRAEETGFIGCQGLLRSAAVPARTAVIGLECSPRRATAKVGRGPVVRVGDKQSIFQPWITHHLQECAAALKAKHEHFVFQRALMDGGSCESTAYNLWDVPAGGLCLALGNYHNCGPRDSIAPEFVDWDDFESLVALMREATLAWGGESAGAKMRARLDTLWSREYNRLAASAQRIRARS
jgi:endoglucanase